MYHEHYCYVFGESVPAEDIEAALLLAVFTTESLHGAAQVLLDASYNVNEDERACTIDASTPVGLDLNRLFVSFIRREFGEDAFLVERIQTASHSDGVPA